MYYTDKEIFIGLVVIVLYFIVTTGLGIYLFILTDLTTKQTILTLLSYLLLCSNCAFIANVVKKIFKGGR